MEITVVEQVSNDFSGSPAASISVPPTRSCLCSDAPKLLYERHKTLTGLMNTEPVVGAHHPRAQKLQWFLSESSWDERQVQAKRLRLLLDDPSTAPTQTGVLVIDETGD